MVLVVKPGFVTFEQVVELRPGEVRLQAHRFQVMRFGLCGAAQASQRNALIKAGLKELAQ